MKHLSAKTFIEEVTASAGIQLNGDNPWDIQVHDENFYPAVIRDGSLGLGESYMNKWWDCQQIDQMIERLLRANVREKFRLQRRLFIKYLFLRLVNQQTKRRALEVGEKHYDLGNDLFLKMLDHRLNYSCGYWKSAKNLEEAELAKLELCCQKLKLQPGLRVLDIGCGFGAFSKYAAEKYGVNVVGITISREQCAFAKKNCAGLPIDIRLQDYRDIDSKFDRIISIGMFEHVGYLNYRRYMQVITDHLTDDGIFLLHTIGGNESTYAGNEWLAKYIFPNGMLPSVVQIAKAAEGLFIMEDWHNFGVDYAPTLLAWHANFNRHWESLRQHYDERFYRMWNYYLLCCAGAFRARTMQLWQVVFSKRGLVGGYQSVR